MKRKLRPLSLMLTMALMSTAFSMGVTVNAATPTISYSFSGEQAADSGYAQGTITFTAGAAGTYRLYWADDEQALEGYTRIAKYTMSAGDSESVTLGYHTVIPAGATKIIACTDGATAVSDAAAVYDIPLNKQLEFDSGDLLYTFSAYSDIHIDANGFYKEAVNHFNEGLAYASDKGSDYIVVSGDIATNANGPDKEWALYEQALSQSDFVNPVWESDGNHDMRSGVASGLSSFIKHSGTDGTKETFDSGNPYFYKVEEKTGDLFLFMGLELSKDVNSANVFSDEQLEWAENLINEYTAKGVNIFLVQHAPINGYGAGDRMDDPYYGGLLSEENEATVKFKNLIAGKDNIIWLSGHTHEDFELDYNYSDDNGNSPNMLHIPSLAGSTMPKSDGTGLDYNDGYGYHSQGYFAEVYENKIVFYGVNIADNYIYPAYSYVMDSVRKDSGVIENTEQNIVPTGNIVSIESKLSEASDVLSTYSAYASYDQYQALKKLYRANKGQTEADSSVAAAIDEAIAALKDIAEHTGMPKTYPVRSEYYFENNKKWSNVYAYAWTGDNHNAEWPGVQISKTGTSNGYDVYTAAFDYAGQYQNLIFNSGKGGEQTVDIGLAFCKFDSFRLASTTDSKYNVTNFSMETGVEEGKVALIYYIENVHPDWTDTSTLMTQNADGTYQIKVTATGSYNMSMSLYDINNSKYKSLVDSVGIDYAEGMNEEITLNTYSSRNKSFTVRGLTKGDVFYLVYDPKTEKLTFSTDSPVPELVNNSTVSAESVVLGGSVNITAAAEGGTGEYTYAMYFKNTETTYWNTLQDYSEAADAVFVPVEAGTYDIRVDVKDNQGTVVSKSFTLVVMQKLTNTSEISSLKVKVGETITVNASAEGGTGDYMYSVFYKRASGSSWVAAQSSSTNQNVTVKLSNAEPYEIYVKVKDSQGTIASKKFKVDVQAKLKNTSAISSEAIQAGCAVTVTASAEGGTGDYQYAVYRRQSTSDKWISSQAYSSNQSVRIRMNYEGTYQVLVKVKDSEGSVSSKTFTVAVQSKLKNTSVLSSEYVLKGESVTVSASAEGGTGNYQYAVYYKKSISDKWMTAQSYSDNSQIEIHPALAVDYDICVKVRDSSGTVVKEYYTVSVYNAIPVQIYM